MFQMSIQAARLRPGVTALFALVLLSAGAGARAQTTPNDRVTAAALGTWVHGVTDELAEREVGEAGVPQLIRLLEDPSFARRDNVVAFLGHLGGPEATRALVRFLKSPPASLALAQEDRALLLAPQALGQIARRRDPGALDVLLDMTEHGGNGGVLAAAAAKAKNPASMRDDLLEMALRGLGHSGDPRAKGRLQAIAAGQHKPAPQGRDQRKSAATALELFDQLEAGSQSAAPPPDPPLDEGALRARLGSTRRGAMDSVVPLGG